MEPWVVGFELLGAAAAAAALVVGILWAKQDHKDDAQRDERKASLRAEISRLDGEIQTVEDWIRTPPTDVTKIKDAKTAELYSLRDARARTQGKLEALEGDAEGVPVAASKKAFDRAKLAGILGMAAIIFGAAAGIFGLFTGDS